MRKIWTKEKVIEEARKYVRLKDFNKKCRGAYNAARKNGYLNELTWLIKQKQLPNGYWDYNHCIEESKKYSSRNEFKKGNNPAYHKSVKEKWIDDMVWLKPIIKPFRYWNNKNNVIEESKKYKTLKDFIEKSSCAYNAALKNGYLNELTWLIRDKKKMDTGMIMKIAIMQQKNVNHDMILKKNIELHTL